MSVSFNLFSQDESAFELSIPISSESFFNEHWLPASEQLNLELVSLFSPGITVSSEDKDQLLNELTRLKFWAEKLENEDAKAYMTKRINELQNSIQRYLIGSRKVYIG